ncbi:undecaprenyl-diphosphatase UppP [Maledivibacter halophilus]|uniref:Undecaprenyl-diphosphatase n=1 Tax=Maledivibacter halophilus TaxID=36842 RepID=A0A1T5MTR4_9FIRM|nr:undecaprenyl-diphosphatase UppP [Maledivibacter halophilus]SKC91572.1 Undecaprenyl-diphosphatase [Maledivibacter halophilus]
MNIVKAIILGIVQGLTEFLPVSSSGHLAITQSLLNVPEDKVVFLTVMLHFGTLISVFFIYFYDIFKIVVEFFKLFGEFITGRGFKLNNQYRKLGIFIIVSSIPTGVMGVFFKDIFASFFTSQLVVGLALIITGILLWLAERMHRGQKSVNQMKWWDAAVVGTFQGLAITPGISRSGSTIVGSLLLGFNKELATKFSFLISIPAILGATVFQVKDVMAVGLGDFSLGIILAGVLSAFFAGLLAIKSLISFIKREKLYYFSYYTWIIGTIIVLITLME